MTVAVLLVCVVILAVSGLLVKLLWEGLKMGLALLFWLFLVMYFIYLFNT